MLANLTQTQLKQTLGALRHLLRSKRHFDFVRNVEEEEDCFRPKESTEQISDSCQFIIDTKACNNVVNIFNYLKFYVCTLQLDASAYRGLPYIMVTGVILCLYFIGLYVNAKYFLLPNSIVLASYLNLQNYGFGNIVLGILYTLPFHLTMIFSCFEYNRTDALLHAQSLGKMFTCFIIGLCLLSYRRVVQLNPHIFLREMLFMIIATIYLYAAVYREMVNSNLPPDSQKESVIHIHAYVNILIYVVYAMNVIMFSKRRSTTPATPMNLDMDDVISIGSIESDTYFDLNYNPLNYDIKPWKQFLDCIDPWKALDRHYYIMKIVMSPFYVFYAMFIPVVNRRKKLNGWCKGIACCSFLVFPLYILLLDFEMESVIFFSLVGCIIALVMAVLTHAQREPRNHELLALWGLIIGFAIFNLVDLEICCILWQYLKYLFNMDGDVIVIVVFPLSFVFVEGIIVLTLMGDGYHQMALGFIMGTVLFIAYSALPVMLFSMCFADTNYFYSLTDNTTTTFYFMLLIEAFVIFGFSVNGFELRPSFSLYFGLITIIFSLNQLLNDANLIHSYGTIHSLTVFVDILHSQWT